MGIDASELPDFPSQKITQNLTSDDDSTPIENRGGGIILIHGIFPVLNPGKMGGWINGKITPHNVLFAGSGAGVM
jgi:hypothetical protein